MGCGGSKTGGASGKSEGADTSKSGGQGSAQSVKLLDKYTLGEVLGQGAFGVVYACAKKGTKETYAVKMVDMAESPLAEIKKECETLKKLAHPCVVKLHDVYYEKVFVCIVMDIIKGGDMINGMQAHWQSKGTIAYDTTQNVSKQMIQAIAWLHQNNHVHRDLKGDNFLMDHKAIEDPKCRIYLTDFGTVVEIPSGHKLSAKCGTKLYWSPEFYALNYSFKVDIWAIGVIMYGLVTGRFPFKCEADVKAKVLILPTKFPKEGRELIMGMLDRDEERRFSAQKCLDTPFMSVVKSAAWEEMQELDKDFKPEMKEAGANQGIAQRRAELIQRLQDAKVGETKSLLNSVGQIAKPDGFEVTNPQTGLLTKYEWWSKAKVDQANLMDSSAKPAPAEDSQDDLDEKTEAIIKNLAEHGIKTDAFGQGKAKTVKEFAREVLNGSSRLMLDAASYKNMVRVVDVVLLRIYTEEGAGKRYLIKMSEKYPDGRMRESTQLPGTKKEPHENGMMTAKRVVEDRLGLADGNIQFQVASKEYFEDEEESPSYPGVRTVYRKEIFEGRLTTTDATTLQHIGVVGGGKLERTDSLGYLRSYAWLTEAECQQKSMKYKAPKEGAEVSALVHAPVGLEEEELNNFLTNNKVDVSQFGQGTNRTLQEFSAELVSGEAVLQRRPNRKVTRIVDVLVLYITKKDGSILVETQQKLKDGTVNSMNRLPAAKRRSDENQFLAAQRVLNKVLRIAENCVNLNPEGVKYFEEEKESKGYCGLPTLYQKRYVFGKLLD